MKPDLAVLLAWLVAVPATSPCEGWKQEFVHTLQDQLVQTQLARETFVIRATSIAHGGTDYKLLFEDTSAVLQGALDTLTSLASGSMMDGRKGCITSRARGILGRALIPLHEALRQHVATMWWVFDVGLLSNTMSPGKHIEQVWKTLTKAEASLVMLWNELPDAFDDLQQVWGHEPHGMFINTTVLYRKMFPEASLVDKGILRSLLRLLPVDASVADFGALDGHYATWLNDTGLVSGFAFDGVSGISEITEGRVQYLDLAQPFTLWRRFDWLLCLEVAEHIAREHETVFLSNLARHATWGIVLSWAPPHVEGEGHVNCRPLEESRDLVEALGFAQDEYATRMLRASAELSWIAESVALYRRVSNEQHEISPFNSRM